MGNFCETISFPSQLCHLPTCQGAGGEPFRLWTPVASTNERKLHCYSSAPSPNLGGPRRPVQRPDCCSLHEELILWSLLLPWFLSPAVGWGWGDVIYQEERGSAMLEKEPPELWACISQAGLPLTSLTTRRYHVGTRLGSLSFLLNAPHNSIQLRFFLSWVRTSSRYGQC